jgi:hypothetical protein
MKLFEVLTESKDNPLNLDRAELNAANRDKLLRSQISKLPPGERHDLLTDPRKKKEALQKARAQQKQQRQQSHQEKQQQAQYNTLQQQTAAVFGPTITSQNIMEVLPQLFSKFRTNRAVVSEIFNAMSHATKKDRDEEFKRNPIDTVAKDIKRKLNGDQIRELKKKLSEDQATTPQMTPEMIRFKAKEIQQAFADLDIHEQRLLYTKLQNIIQGEKAGLPSLDGIRQKDIRAAERGDKVGRALKLDKVIGLKRRIMGS